MKDLIYEYQNTSIVDLYKEQKAHNFEMTITKGIYRNLEIYNHEHDVWSYYSPLDLNYTFKVDPSTLNTLMFKYSKVYYVDKMNRPLFKLYDDFKSHIDKFEDVKDELLTHIKYGRSFITTYNEFVKEGVLKVKVLEGGDISKIENHYWIKKNGVKIEMVI